MSHFRRRCRKLVQDGFRHVRPSDRPIEIGKDGPLRWHDQPSARRTECSRPFLPGIEVGTLCFRQVIDSDPHAPELQPRDFQVKGWRDGMNPRLQPGGVLREIASGHRLNREAHVHDLDGMALARRDVHEASFGAGKCAAVTMSLQPVAVTMKSASRTALRMGTTSNPSIEASIAFTESTSVTTTRAPIPRARIAMPRPVHP